MAPKYQQIAGILRSDILDGVYAKQMRLPTEQLLCQQFQVSRQTVRQALSVLASEGYIERRQGSGSHILDRSQGTAVPRKSIAVVTTYISNYIFPSILREIESVLARNSSAPTLYATQNQISNERRILQSLLDSPPAQSGDSAGKLILSDLWYFAVNLPADAAQRLSPGGTALLRFQGDFTQDVDMTVVQVGEPEGDQCTVVFSSDRYLSRTTLLRRQTAQLIFDSWSGLRIPKTALRLVEETVTDEETGQEATETRLGVYALVNKRTEFKEVEVLTEGSDYYVVSPVGTGRRILRAGDEVITQATGLEDGQLLIE